MWDGNNLFEVKFFQNTQLSENQCGMETKSIGDSEKSLPVE